MFGENIQISILKNIAQGRTSMANAIQVVFMVLLGCHIPYIFYAAKECFLVMIDELMRKSISQHMQL